MAALDEHLPRISGAQLAHALFGSTESFSTLTAIPGRAPVSRAKQMYALSTNASFTSIASHSIASCSWYSPVWLRCSRVEIDAVAALIACCAAWLAASPASAAVVAFAPATTCTALAAVCATLASCSTPPLPLPPPTRLENWSRMGRQYALASCPDGKPAGPKRIGHTWFCMFLKCTLTVFAPRPISSRCSRQDASDCRMRLVSRYCKNMTVSCWHGYPSCIPFAQLARITASPPSSSDRFISPLNSRHRFSTSPHCILRLWPSGASIEAAPRSAGAAMG